MNCNMMYKRILIFIVGFLLAPLFGIETSMVSFAEELKGGDILIIYSDHADKETIQSVSDVVEFFTYQSFQVSYGNASLCMPHLNQFSYVICYDLQQYPAELTNRLYEYEKKDTVTEKRESPHIFFIGNKFLKDYLDDTNRSDRYERVESSIGELNYSFRGLDLRTELIKEDDFLFLKPVTNQRGMLIVRDKNGYFCAKAGKITHVPVTDITNHLVRAALIKELSQWKWPYNGSPHVFPQYILIHKVYPYEDPGKLLKVVKSLTDKKTPFVISVMPMYVNGDYPSMIRFCEVLRYAQANGGAVVMSAPINQMNRFDKEVVLDYLTQAMEIYNKQGVYPLALEVPRNWLFKRDTIEIMSHFKTIFTNEELDSYIKPDESNTNEVYKDGHQWVGYSISLNDTGASEISAYSMAVPISLSEDYDEIEEKIKACKDSFVPLKSLWDMEHGYWLDKQLMEYKDGNFLLNGKKMDLSFTPSVYPEHFNYHRNMLLRFSKDLTSQNKRLVILVGITSVIFMFLILFARYFNRKHYFFPETGKDQTDKSRKD